MTIRSQLVVLLVVTLLASAARAERPDWRVLADRYRQEVSRNPSSVEGHFSLAVVYAHEGRLIDGWEHLKRVDRLVGGEKGRGPIARRFMEESQASLRRDPDDVFALYRLAFAAYFANRKDVALRAMQRAASLEPKNAWTMGYVGFLYGERQEVDQAIAWWERGIRVDPRNAVLHYMLGLAYSHKGDMKRAAYHFTLAYRDRTLYEYIKGQRKL